MGDFFWSILAWLVKWLFTERELALMENAPGAVGKIVLAVVGIVTVIEIAGFWFFFSWAYEKQVDALQATIDLKEARITSLENVQNVLKDREKNSVVKEAESSPPLSKYVCTKTFPVRSGKHRLLVEFGVRKGQTNGFYGRILLQSPYTTVSDWTGQSLQKDLPEVAAGIFKLHRPYPDPARLMYQVEFATPSITPQESYYLYFEADQPLQVQDVLFVEDYNARSDQLRVNKLGKQYETCPQ